MNTLFRYLHYVWTDQSSWHTDVAFFFFVALFALLSVLGLYFLGIFLATFPITAVLMFSVPTAATVIYCLVVTFKRSKE